jgi:glyoxylase-like metal-dependent hydrolase (beta-lactamase superfamily II)
MLKKINLSSNVIKIISDSNVYIVEKEIVIDTSSHEFNQDLKETLQQIVPLNKIKKVIFTHLHYDHIGNANLFPNAEFFANTNEDDFKNNKLKYILNPVTTNNFKIDIKDIFNNKDLNQIFNIIKTPGHCKSCIILYYNKDNILFTGDTYFHESCYGRTDLPTSEPEKIKESLKKVQDYIDKKNPIIAPGHDY